MAMGGGRMKGGLKMNINFLFILFLIAKEGFNRKLERQQLNNKDID